MMDKQKARPTAATVERAEAAAFERATTSCRLDCITSMRPRQVSDVLMHGAENAVDGATLAMAFGFKNRRELSKVIEKERRSGQPICAAVAGDHRGYYLATTPDELDKYIRSLDRRIREVRRTREACGETLRRMTGQETMEGWNV